MHTLRVSRTVYYIFKFEIFFPNDYNTISIFVKILEGKKWSNENKNIIFILSYTNIVVFFFLDGLRSNFYL